MTDRVRDHLLHGYRMLDTALGSGFDPFARGHSQWLLELNTRVLCGVDPKRREEFAAHIAATERHFYGQDDGGIGGLIGWLERHREDAVWLRAAGAYVYVLSRPQLYLEGNHRTGALIMSALLAREGAPPFVLSVDNAKAYFDPSTLVKDVRKQGLDLLIRVPKLKQRLAQLLRASGTAQFLIAA
ncbi:MAG: hypothetical protein EA400_03215 [Chromatiaceae bacterium]|nr:MAG: hypothetical protein EA400_03215 [Chromatiaceae bacterium]